MRGIKSVLSLPPGRGSDAWALMTAGALLLSGCAGPQQPVSVQPAQEAMRPQRGGVFQTIGIRPLEHLHPWRQSTPANASFYLNGSSYDQLVDYAYRPDEDHRFTDEIIPELAERWELRDNTAYTFSLRKNVKWHDGRPFTATDAKWSIEFLADPANKVLGIPDLKGIEAITAPDDHTLQIKLKDPDVDFLRKLTNQSRVSMLPKHVHDRGDSFEKVQVGTGPFKVESYTRDRGVVYAANKEYWKPDMPYLDKVRILPPVDEAGRTAAFFAGQNDVMKAGAKVQAETVAAQNPQARISTFFQEANVEMWLRLDRPPFNDQRVRQAVHLTVDRQAMIGTLTSGDGLMNAPVINSIYKRWVLPPADFQSMPGWRTPKEQDLSRAKQLLGEAGYGQGLSFTIKVDRNNPNWPAVAEMISEQLRQAGVDAKLQPMESATYNKSIADGDFESYVSGGGTPTEWTTMLHSTGVNNLTRLRDPEVDRLIQSQVREFDQGKRGQGVRELQRLLIRQAYTVPTITYAGYLIEQPWAHGYVDGRGANVSNPDWSQLWLDQATVPTNR